MIPKENLKEFEISGILRWHELGYTGKGISIASLEGFNPNAYFLKGKVKNPFGRDNGDAHGTQVMDIILQVAPEAELHSVPFFPMTISGGKVTGGFMDNVLPYLYKNVDIITTSSINRPNKTRDEMMLETQEKGLIWLCAAGNDTDEISGYGKSDAWIAVGAVGYRDIDGEIFRKGYSNTGKYLNLMSFSGLYFRQFEKESKYPPYQLEGTSFSTPMAAAMMCLAQQFFKEKAGRKLYQDEMMEFIKDFSVDLGEEGFDHLHGWGLFVLPEPSKIDVKKYLLRGSNEMIFKDTKGHWAEKAIDRISDKGLMAGYPDGSFKPDQPITRAELAVVLERVLKNE